MAAYRRLLFVVLSLTGTLMVGVIGYMHIESLGFLDALYLTVVTLATVGYGDVVPVTAAGRAFTICLVIAGVGLVAYSFSTILSMTVEGHLQNLLGRRVMNKRIGRLRDHVIVCGAGRVGANVIDQLMHEGVDFVVIDHNPEITEGLQDQGVLVVAGDATLDETLQSTGIEYAKGIITTLSHDADNVYVTLTAKSLNPDIKIVARGERPESEGKLLQAGATSVIFPSVIGGRQMVTALMRPVIMGFVEDVFYNQEVHLDIASIHIEADSYLVGRTLQESGIREHFLSTVVAIQRGEMLLMNLKANEIIQNRDILIIFGQRNQLSALASLAQGPKSTC